MKTLQNVAALAILFFVIVSGTSLAQSTPPDPLKLLPTRLNGYRRSSSPRPFVTQQGSQGALASGVQVAYLSTSGRRFTVELAITGKDSEAYSLFTFFLQELREKGTDKPIESTDIGTASALLTNRLVVFKGQTALRITELGSLPPSSEELIALGRLVTETVNDGGGGIPVLVKHLPDWEAKQERALYFVDSKGLLGAVGNQPVLEPLSFDGGAEAVVAPYENSQLVMIEFSTPQLAGDNDRRTSAKILELWQAGQTAPTAYRRVGNYLVFVFNGQSEQAANQLIDQIKYEQVVQWLGDNPYLLLEAQRQYTETTLGVFLAVVKASALALLACLGVGGLFGGLLFMRRRAQQKAVEAFSDAGGMLRLNLDEMTPQTDPARLLRGDS